MKEAESYHQPFCDFRWRCFAIKGVWSQRDPTGNCTGTTSQQDTRRLEFCWTWPCSTRPAMTAFFPSVPNWIQDAKQEEEETGWKLVPRPRGEETESQGKCQCEISEASFTTVDKLRTHTLPHSEQRPYNCPQLHCGKAFASKYKLYR